MLELSSQQMLYFYVVLKGQQTQERRYLPQHNIIIHSSADLKASRTHALVLSGSFHCLEKRPIFTIFCSFEKLRFDSCLSKLNYESGMHEHFQGQYQYMISESMTQIQTGLLFWIK